MEKLFQPEIISDTVQLAQQALLGLQHPDGFWVGQLEADITLEADVILLMYFLHRIDKEKQERLVRSILNAQLEDGGWSIYPGGPSEVSATVKAYFALKLAGFTLREPFMQKANERIRALGGLDRINSFTKITLAIFGQYDWEGVPAIVPEIMLLPKFFYFNIYEMSAWSRTIVVPLSIIYALKPKCELPQSCGVQELRKKNASGAVPSSVKKISWRNFFILLDKLLKLLEKSPIKPLRRYAIKKAERWMLEHFKMSDGLGSIFPAMVNSVIALKALGYSDKDHYLENAIKELEAFEIDDAGALKIQPCFSPVWDTALSIYALVKSGLEPNHPALVKAALWLLEKEVRSYGDWRIKNRKGKPSGWYFEFENGFYPDVDDTAMVCLALNSVALSGKQAIQKEEAVKRAVDWILSMQNKDGGFSSFDKDNNKTIFTHLPFADHNAMLDPSSSDITGRVLELLGSLGFKGSYPAAARAIEFLKRNQEKDGSWYGRWGVNYIYGTWQVLRGLISIGEDMQKDYCRKAARWLLLHQNEDGGWGETCYSYDDPASAGIGPSTPSQTAWALMGLLSAGEAEYSANIQKGFDYLALSQNQYGFWDESYFTGTGFPCVFYLKYHLYRLYFPLLAFGMRYKTELRYAIPSRAEYLTSSLHP